MGNFVMKRDLFDLVVEQRTIDGYFNATLLFQQWNERNPNQERRMQHFFESQAIKRFVMQTYNQEVLSNQQKINDIYYPEIRENEILRKTEIRHFVKDVDIEQLAFEYSIRKKKGRGLKGGGKTKDTVWVHPYLFIKVAQYISSEFDYMVTKFVYDKLIQYRIDLCERYTKWCDFLKYDLNAGTWDYSNTQKAMNKAVFGSHSAEIRDTATESQLKRMEEYENTIYNMYDLGLIRNCKDVRNALKVFTEKGATRKYRE